jgi:arsenate reductase (thioredoxin)
MTPRVWNVLFLCTGNSARSILAETLLRDRGEGRFRAFSAGSHPAGEVNPFALDYLRKRRIDASGLASKSWEAFAGADSPKMDFVITVCDNAAGEVCPIWPGHPSTAHWGVPDPAHVAGTDDAKRAAFAAAATALEARIRRLVQLPLATLDRAAAERAVRAIADDGSG